MHACTHECREEQREREILVDSMLSLESDMGLSLTTLGSWPEPKSGVRLLTHCTTQVPHYFTFLTLNFSHPYNGVIYLLFFCYGN